MHGCIKYKLGNEVPMCSHFAGHWFRTFCGLKGILHAEAISYRSSTNGRAERAIESILDALRKLQRDGISWPQALPTALGKIRVAPGPSGMSPFQIVYGRDILQQGLPLPVVQEAEDAVNFQERMSKVDSEVQKNFKKNSSHG